MVFCACSPRSRRRNSTWSCLKAERPSAAFTFYREELSALREGWTAQRDAVAAALRDPALDGRVYGSLKLPAVGVRRESERERRVDGLLDAMDVFLGSLRDFPPFRGFELFHAEQIAAKTRRHSQPPRHPVFDLCQRVADEAEALGAELALHLRRLKAELVQFARTELTRRKQSRNLQAFDDLLTSLWRSLTGSGGRGLVESVRRRFRAALVDEFLHPSMSCALQETALKPSISLLTNTGWKTPKGLSS